MLLRRDSGSGRYGPPIPLADLEELDRFFAGLSWSGEMYGWRFLDDDSRGSDWPAPASLELPLADGSGTGAATHSLYWFNECGRGSADAAEAFCVEGVISFEDLQVLRADGSDVPLEEFVADGRRYWSALHENDERLSSRAQAAAAANAARWRGPPASSSVVPG